MSVNNQLISIYIGKDWTVKEVDGGISLHDPDNVYPMGVVVHIDGDAKRIVEEIHNLMFGEKNGDRKAAEGG